MSKVKAIGIKTAAYAMKPAEYTLGGAGVACHVTATGLRVIANGFDKVGCLADDGAAKIRARSEAMIEKADALIAEANSRQAAHEAAALKKIGRKATA